MAAEAITEGNSDRRRPCAQRHPEQIEARARQLERPVVSGSPSGAVGGRAVVALA
jgi:ketosteroid isomerase-like protein